MCLFWSGPSKTGLIAYFTFESDRSLLSDTAYFLGDLQASGDPSYVSDCVWLGSQCAALTSYGDSSGGGQYFRLNTIELGAMSASTGFSICTWFVYDATTPWARIFDFSTPTNPLTLHRYEYSNQLRFSGYLYYQFSSPIVNGQWRHVCVVNQGSSWGVYDDGSSVGSVFGANLDSSPFTSNFIGRSRYPQDPLLVGRVDEFRIYQKSLFPSDVASIYRGFSGTERCVPARRGKYFLS